MRLPAEWEKQSCVMLTWPHGDTPWYERYVVQRCYARIISALQKFEPVMLVCPSEWSCRMELTAVAAVEKVEVDTDAIRYAEAPCNDTWSRDHGGIAVHRDEGEMYVYDFVFNGWGLKFASNLDNLITKTILTNGAYAPEVMGVDMSPFVLEGGSIDSDGQGTLLTTEECLLSENRNSYLEKEEIEAELCHAFGLKRILWLSHGSIDGDDTDGHVDIMARFCSPDTIAYSVCEDPSSPNYKPLRELEDQLRTFRTLDGKPYKLVPLPIPTQQYLEGYPLPASYVNYLIINGAVLIPAAGDPNDKVAVERLAPLFPGRETILVDCRPLLSGHGGLHCVTMNYPEGWIL